MYQIFNKYTGRPMRRTPREPMKFYNEGDALHYLRTINIDPSLYEVRKVEE